MHKMLVRHRVVDFNQWKSIFTMSDIVRKACGEKSYVIFRGVEDPEEVTILFEWGDLDKALKYSQSEELRSGMEAAGVLGDPVISVWEEDLKQ